MIDQMLFDTQFQPALGRPGLKETNLGFPNLQLLKDHLDPTTLSSSKCYMSRPVLVKYRRVIAVW